MEPQFPSTVLDSSGTKRSMLKHNKKVMQMNADHEPSHVDKEAFDVYYLTGKHVLETCTNVDDYVSTFERRFLSPFYAGGTMKGFMRGLSVKYLLDAVAKSGRPPEQATVMDAGCGRGTLSVYLACKGFNVIGVDISETACSVSDRLANTIGVGKKVQFLARSLDDLFGVDDNSIDYVIGHEALHHFIKYEKVPRELRRVMKADGKAYFADGFGENRLYHVFWDRKRRECQGDVCLTRRLITDYFSGFKVTFVATDWFTMLDKLYLRILPSRVKPLVRKLSRIHFALDRLVERASWAVFLSGKVITIVDCCARPS